MFDIGFNQCVQLLVELLGTSASANAHATHGSQTARRPERINSLPFRV